MSRTPNELCPGVWQFQTPLWQTNSLLAVKEGEADIAYIERIIERAREVTAAGLAPGLALVEVYGIAPPRATTDDFEVYNLRSINAKQALNEAQQVAA